MQARFQKLHERTHVKFLVCQEHSLWTVRRWAARVSVQDLSFEYAWFIHTNIPYTAILVGFHWRLLSGKDTLEAYGLSARICNEVLRLWLWQAGRTALVKVHEFLESKDQQLGLASGPVCAQRKSRHSVITKTRTCTEP